MRLCDSQIHLLSIVAIPHTLLSHRLMKKILCLLPLIFLLADLSHAKDTVEVDRVNFNSLRGDWIQMEVELSCNANPSPEARDSRFVEKIKVKVYLAWLRDAQERRYDYYTSEVEIVIMEQGEDYNVYFYLPGLIAERDRLKEEPDFYYVEVAVNDEMQQPSGGSPALSSNITNLEILSSFTSKANAEGQQNEHMLMPIYLVQSGIDLGRVSELPIFLRRDVRQ